MDDRSYRERKDDLDPEEVTRQIKGQLSKITKRLGGGGPLALMFLGIVMLLWLASGTYQVNPGEQAVLRTFGKFTGTASEGLHWWWPSPIGKRNVESIEEVRSMELGIPTSSQDVVEATGEARMIAGDLNIVDVPLVIQYRISDLPSFLFRVADPGDARRDVSEGRPEGRTLKDATEAALRLVVGQRTIDDVLAERKEEIQTATHELLQQILTGYGAGIQILSVRLQDVRPPTNVIDAFNDVLRARQDKETVINQAQAYQRDIIPRARGEVERITQGAEAYRRERIARAEGEAARFLAILNEYQNSPDVTRQRLYLEAMEEILPNISKYIVSPDAGGNLLQHLTLQQAQVVQPPVLTPTPIPSPVPAGGR